jgi:hypothetical protein
MTIQAKKLDLIERLIWLTDTEALNKIDKLLNKTIKEKYESKLHPMTGAQYKSRLEKAEENLKHKRVIKQDDLEKESENW